MGGNIRVSGRVAVVTGVERLHGAGVRASDLRGGAALVLAALAAEGRSEIAAGQHIERGYENFAGTLTALGASVIQVQDERTGDSEDGQTQKFQSKT
jgi:UDP-N-acetylglucosamine 1-carboxyvinyltransferase